MLKLLMPMLILWAGAAGAEYQVPRTTFGDPDLKGIWTNATITTLERPDGVENLVLTDEQAAVLEDRRKAFYESYEASGQGEGTPEPGGGSGWLQHRLDGRRGVAGPCRR